MAKQYFYHVSKDHHIHKGRSTDCHLCSRGKKSKKQICKTSGSNGGKKSAASVNTRTCKCGAAISHKNITGMCIRCLNEKRRVDKEKRSAAQRRKKEKNLRFCRVETCSNKLDPANKTGFCAKCYRKSDLWRQRRENQSDWIGAVIFEKDAKVVNNG